MNRRREFGDALARRRHAHSRLADAYVNLGRSDAALDHARKALTLDRSLAGVDVNSQRTLASTLETLGSAEQLAGDVAAACQAFHRAADILVSVQSRSPLTPEAQDLLVQRQTALRGRLARCGHLRAE